MSRCQEWGGKSTQGPWAGAGTWWPVWAVDQDMGPGARGGGNKAMRGERERSWWEMRCRKTFLHQIGHLRATLFMNRIQESSPSVTGGGGKEAWPLSRPLSKIHFQKTEALVSPIYECRIHIYTGHAVGPAPLINDIKTQVDRPRYNVTLRRHRGLPLKKKKNTKQPKTKWGN